MLEQRSHQPAATKIAMAQYPTKVIMHLEPVKIGDCEKEMPLSRWQLRFTEETEIISMQESVVQEAWHGWEESLRMAPVDYPEGHCPNPPHPLAILKLSSHPCQASWTTDSCM